MVSGVSRLVLEFVVGLVRIQLVLFFERCCRLFFGFSCLLLNSVLFDFSSWCIVDVLSL